MVKSPHSRILLKSTKHSINPSIELQPNRHYFWTISARLKYFGPIKIKWQYQCVDLFILGQVRPLYHLQLHLILLLGLLDLRIAMGWIFGLLVCFHLFIQCSSASSWAQISRASIMIEIWTTRSTIIFENKNWNYVAPYDVRVGLCAIWLIFIFLSLCSSKMNKKKFFAAWFLRSKK